MTTNKYAATCFRCGEVVPAGEGDLDYVSLPGVRWPELAGLRSELLIQHQECRVLYYNTNTHYLYKPAAKGETLLARL